ncbi:MAG: TldD/PmbA family protein [Candidatus Riflebacteria bacterium]|nr:TldD/PmbA family protein [Candidatus Riflebacteria bacterium]
MYNFPKNFYSDVRIEHLYHSEISIKLGELEEIKEARESGAFIRLFDGSRWYYSSTTDLNSINAELADLAKLAEPNPDIENHPVVMKMEVNKGDKRKYQENHISKVSLEEKKALLEHYAKITKEYEDITHWSIAYTDSNLEKEFISSKGCHVQFDTQITGVRLGFTFGVGSDAFREMWSRGFVDFEGLKGREEAIKHQIDKALFFYKNAETIPGGDYTVVLSPMASGVFAHESFGHKSESDFMVGDPDLIAEWQIGKRVGSEKLTIVDDGNLEGIGYTPYDDEGNKAVKTYLINKGILTGRLHSADTAVALDEELTGNARAINFEYEPIVRMTSTYIDAGDLSKKDLIKDIEYGILIDTIKHGSGMSTFTIAPSMAYLIEDGKVTKPVKFSVVTGNVMKTLDKIDAVSKELEVISFVGGGCGKMEQFPLPVGIGGPYVRVREINVQ